MSDEVKEKYKETRLGAISVEWEVTQLDEVTYINMGSSPPSETYNEDKDGLPFFQGNADFGYLYPEANQWCSEPQKIAEKDDILISVRAPVGAMNIAPFECCIGRGVAAIRGERADTKFIFYFLSQFKRLLESYSQGSTFSSINQKVLKTFPVALPSLSEQKKIADILSTVDKTIAKTDEIIEKSKELKKGLMQELLTKGIGHDEFKEVRIGVKEYEIPLNWEVTKLEKCCEICYGKAQDDVEDDTGDYPILGTGGKIGCATDYLFDEPSVLIGRKGTIDEPKFIDEPFWTIDTLFYTDVYENTFPKWLYYYLDYYDLTLLNEATGVPSLNRKNLYNLDIPFPPLEEQKKIANILSTVDKKIQKKKEKKEKLERLKKGLMQKLLTGKVRVNVDDA